MKRDFSKKWEWKNMTNDAKILSKMQIEIGSPNLSVSKALLPQEENIL